jgi:hypothetical protein
MQIEKHEWRRSCEISAAERQAQQGLQVLWTMHADALDWSRATAMDCAAAHDLSVCTLLTWRARLDADSLLADCRTRLHPSASQHTSPKTSSAAKGSGGQNVRITTAPVLRSMAA